MPLLEVDGEIVSSSHIRGLVLAGDVGRGRRACSARRSELRGEVVHGDQRGRELGFPTANLVPDEALVCPATASTRAVRATAARRRRSTSACGPTFETGRGELIEAFLLDFDGDLYGQQLRLEFLARLRGERRFDSVEALVEQMHRDVAQRAIWRRAALAPSAGAGVCYRSRR